MRIVLLGYMGSGKSAVGKRLAEHMCLDFIDLDNHIEQEQGMSISRIFELRGEEVFRSLESANLRHIIESKDNIVLSLGGGTPCFDGNMEFLNTTSSTIYLTASPQVLAQRLRHGKAKRPLIMQKSEEELEQFITQALCAREAFYSTAHHTICVDDINIAQVVKKIFDTIIYKI